MSSVSADGDFAGMSENRLGFSMLVVVEGEEWCVGVDGRWGVVMGDARRCEEMRGDGGY